MVPKAWIKAPLEAPTRKMKITKADSCLQVDIKILRHILLRVGLGMAAMAARAIWKGSISFGLVNIPIQVFSATQKEEYTHLISFAIRATKSNTKNGVLWKKEKSHGLKSKKDMRSRRTTMW